MSRVLFIGDLHFGHKNVIRFRPQFSSVEEHDAYIEAQWSGTVTKSDLVMVLGDVAFSLEGLERMKRLPGRKILVRGNHDVFSAQRYLVFFEDICGITKYKHCWLTHAPIHPDELRGRINIHGHVHSSTLPDKRYVNVSAEATDYAPITFAEVLNRARPANLPEE